MDQNEFSNCPERWGRIVAEADDKPADEFDPSILPPGATSSIYTWQPPDVLKDQLPEDFQIRLRCTIGPDGIRRFYPEYSFEHFITHGFAGGLAILAQLTGMSAELRYSYRAMYQLYRRLTQTREHLTNNLLSVRGLSISQVARDIEDERTILPEEVGRYTDGRGEPWSGRQLMKEGYTAAQAAGRPNPNEEQCLIEGFVVAARRNPLPAFAAEVAAVVRMSVYETVDAERRDEEFVGQVVERTFAAMWNHLEQPASDFDAWFCGPNNSLIHQIAKQKRAPGGPLDRNLVRRALQELGWSAYLYVADCLHALMWLLQKLMPDPLSEAERQRFEHMHLKQGYLGDLTVALLAERLPWLKTVLWNIWESDAEEEWVPVLHRIMAWYEEISCRRRQVDRLVKSRRPSRVSEGERTPMTVPSESEFSTPSKAKDTDEYALTGGESDALIPTGEVDDSTSDPSEKQQAVHELFLSLASQIRTRRGIECDCSAPQWEPRLVNSGEESVTVSHGCRQCEFEQTTHLTMEEVRQIGEDLKSEWTAPTD